MVAVVVCLAASAPVTVIGIVAGAAVVVAVVAAIVGVAASMMAE